MDVIDIGLDDPNITRAGEWSIFILVSWRDIVGCGWVRSLRPPLLRLFRCLLYLLLSHSCNYMRFSSPPWNCTNELREPTHRPLSPSP